MTREFVYSDPHFGHAEIIGYESRPFSSVEEMDEALIEYWNEVVGDDDKVLVLGDFSMYGKEKTKSIVARLNGQKHLILGNHDEDQPVSWWREVGFDEVTQYPIIHSGFFIMSHKPLYVNTNMPYVNIHGHTHGATYEGKHYVNVSVEKIGYKPILLTDILARYKFLREGE